MSYDVDSNCDIGIGTLFSRHNRRAYPLPAVTRAQVAALNPEVWLEGGVGYFQDAAGTVPATASGDPVGCWKDQSGNARDMTQATTASKPTLQLLAMANQYPGVFFDGADDVLFSNAAFVQTLWSGLNLPYSCAAALIPYDNTRAANQYVFSMGRSGSNNPFNGVLIQGAGSGTWQNSRRSTVSTDTLGVSDGNSVLNVHNPIVGTFDGTTGKIYSGLTGVSTGPLGLVNTSVLAQLGVGALVRVANTLFYNGYIADWLVWARALSAAEAAIVSGYFVGRYG